METLTFWFIQVPGWSLVAYLLFAQCTAAISYELGVKLGTQEPASNVTETGVAFWTGFAGADLVFYTPLLALALAAQIFDAGWSEVALAASLGITIYWPITCLWAVRAARGAAGWNLPNERLYWLVLPVIALWAAIGLLLLAAT